MKYQRFALFFYDNRVCQHTL